MPLFFVCSYIIIQLALIGTRQFFSKFLDTFFRFLSQMSLCRPYLALIFAIKPIICVRQMADEVEWFYYDRVYRCLIIIVQKPPTHIRATRIHNTRKKIGPSMKRRNNTETSHNEHLNYNFKLRQP